MELLSLIIIVILVLTVFVLLKNEKKKEDFFSNQIKKLNDTYEILKNDSQNRIEKLEKENEEIKEDYKKATHTIEKNKKIIEELNNDLEEQSFLNTKIINENEKLTIENKGLNNELRFYTDIKEESLQLNDISKKDIRIKINPETLNDEQKEVYRKMNDSDENMFITGKAGTGKSYLLRCFKDNTNKKVLYCAPTGVAAINIGAVTIHSAFGYKNIEKEKGVPYKISNNLKTLLENIDTIVIDEISMVRSDVFTKIDEILRKARGLEQTFGGVQMIIIGDVFQLPPVVKDGEIAAYLADNYNGKYFFNTEAYKKGDFNCYELETIVRQNDKDFIDALNSVREGIISEKQIDYLNKRYVEKLPDNSRIIRIVPTKREASDINNKELEKIRSKEYLFEAQTILGEEKITENELPCDFKLRLKLGCLVMMIVNDNQNRRYVNGTLGIVSDISEDMLRVSIDGCEYPISRYPFSRSKAFYDREKKEIIYKDEVCVLQYPVIPAYALTVHKSQGATYQTVAIDVSNTFATGQTYVALSRCSNFKKLYLLSKVTLDTILVDNEVVNFYKNIIRKEILTSK